MDIIGGNMEYKEYGNQDIAPFHGYILEKTRVKCPSQFTEYHRDTYYKSHYQSSQF